MQAQPYFPLYQNRNIIKPSKKRSRLAGLDRVVTVLNPLTRNPEQKYLYEVVTTHTARKTFIGNMYKKVKDPDLVSSVSGHKEGSKAFRRYREIDEEMKQELVHSVGLIRRKTMAKQDFEQFKQDIKEWLNNHPKEYDRFVAEVNNKSATGLQKIFKLGWKLAPQMMRKYHGECHGDLANEYRLQSYSADADAARLLVEEFHNLQNDSIVPAMLAWLYYGKCYETLVTQLEAETHNPANNYFEKRIAALMIKVVINSSIRNKMRTREDWQDFHREKQAIEDDCVVETTIKGLSVNDKPIEEKSPTGEQASRTLKDYLHGNQEMILEKIKLRVSTQHTGTDLARLYFALQEEGLLTGCDVTTFHKLLANELPNCDLKTVRNLQISIKKLNDSTSRGKIKDNGIERSLINEWKAYLAEVNN